MEKRHDCEGKVQERNRKTVLIVACSVATTILVTLLAVGVSGYFYITNSLSDIGVSRAKAKTAQDKKVGKVGDTKSIGDIEYKLVSATEVGGRDEYSKKLDLLSKYEIFHKKMLHSA